MKNKGVVQNQITLDMIRNQDPNTVYKSKAIQKEKALKLMSKLNIPYSLEKPSTDKNDGYVWNGQNFKLGATKTSSNIVHEVAHYLVTPDKNLPEYGLGTAPDGDKSIDSVKVENRQSEEELASVLGILIEYNLGLPAKETFLEHSWHESGSEKIFAITMRKLKKLKYIDNNNVPYCCL